MMACFNSSTLLKTPPRMRFLVVFEALDHVEPRAGSGREAQMKA
jgi:hypothetical protein